MTMIQGRVESLALHGRCTRGRNKCWEGAMHSITERTAYDQV